MRTKPRRIEQETLSLVELRGIVARLEKASKCKKCGKKLEVVMLPILVCPKHRTVVLPERFNNTFNSLADTRKE